MDKFWEKVEHYNSKLIPPSLILLLGVIIFELFVSTENAAILLTVEIIDYLIITIFVIDLIFLAIKSKDAKYFFRNYWLDIIAVFPFAIFFNIISALYKAFSAAEKVMLGQSILHETVEVSKEAKAFSKTSKFLRIVRIIARSLRVITKSRLFTQLGIVKSKKISRKKKKKRKRKSKRS